MPPSKSIYKSALTRLGQHAYRLLARHAKKVHIDSKSLQGSHYCSQDGQDRWVAEVLLPGQHAGVFVDVGAHDGITFSNTLFFEKELGWTGVAIEPNPDVFEQLLANRNCFAVHGCISSSPGPKRYLKVTGYSEMLSGLVDHYDPRHLERVRREVAEHGGSIDEIEVPSFTLNEIVENRKLKHINYLSVDVEGAEVDVLRSLDFRRHPVNIIGAENNYKDWRLPALMRLRGYRLHSIVRDEFYLPKRQDKRG